MSKQRQRKFDVIIIGGSFAGLAVASQLSKWNVLIIDEKPIGKGIKSTCGTLLSLVEKLGLKKTVVKVHKNFIFHTKNKEYIFDLKNHPFCIINEEKFNRTLFRRSKANFLRTRFVSQKNNIVKTEHGKFWGKILVDASGPRAVLTYNVDLRTNRDLFFGIETIVRHKDKDLNYYYLPQQFKNGIFWIFPQGETSRIGIGSYEAKTNLEEALEKFLSKIALKKQSVHGGFGTSSLREAVLNNIFIVGDAAGQCLPLTAEGIRPALVFGRKCGEIINKILSGEISIEKGLGIYLQFTKDKKRHYLFYKFVQDVYIRLPQFLVDFLLRIATQQRISEIIVKQYVGFLDNKECRGDSF